MKNLFCFFILAIAFTFSQNFILFAQEKRTDGPAGSEWADFSKLEGDIRLGAQFGAILPTSDRSDSSFALGADVDYRPYELFGAKITFLQGVTSPRISLLSITPLFHTQISNFHPYGFFGPGIAITNTGGTELKFMLAAGVGGDVDVIKSLSIGLAWTYDILLDSYDAHSLTARFGWKF